MVIGLAGKAGVGKDHIAQQFLVPKGYYKISMAWPLKVALLARNLATFEEVFTTKPEHVRKLLQEEGTERGRDIYGEDYWCLWIQNWLQLMQSEWHITDFVIPDVRFPNEVELVRRLGGKVYVVIAPERQTLHGKAARHRSEIALDHYTGFDGAIYNDPRYAKTVQQQLNKLLGVQNAKLDSLLDRYEFLAER